MADRQVTKGRVRSARVDSPLVAVLKKLGCIYCSRCNAFMYPDHTQHVSTFDLHTCETFAPAPVTLTAEWPVAAAA